LSKREKLVTWYELELMMVKEQNIQNDRGFESRVYDCRRFNCLIDEN